MEQASEFGKKLTIFWPERSMRDAKLPDIGAGANEIRRMQSAAKSSAHDGPIQCERTKAGASLIEKGLGGS